MVSAVSFPFVDLSSAGGSLTNQKGEFSIDELHPNSYLLVANADGKVTSEQPFEAQLYPGVKDHAAAIPFTIGLGEFHENLLFQIPKMEERVTIEGILVYSDNSPVVSGSVWFIPSIQSAGSRILAKTDMNGKFSLKILKNLKGQLIGSEFKVRRDGSCELSEIIAQPTRIRFESKTQTAQINAEKDILDIVLKLTVLNCKKLK